VGSTFFFGVLVFNLWGGGGERGGLGVYGWGLGNWF